MGCASSAHSEPQNPDSSGRLEGVEELPENLQKLPPFFLEILVEVLRRQRELGGRKRFPDGFPTLNDKVKQKEFVSGYTDFEYIFLTVVGVARLHEQLEAIVSQMNGENFTKNPGVQMLERVCGMTMHGDREGATAMLRQAPETLIKAFAVAKSRKGLPQFFREAFDRKADPCLEGRLGRIMAFLEARGGAKGLTSSDSPPWEDVSLQNLGPKATPEDLVGDYLRVFMAECTWSWSREQKLDYEAAKGVRFDAKYGDTFCKKFNASTFEASMWSRGAVHHTEGKRWEVMTDKGNWEPYSDMESARMEKLFNEGRSSAHMKIGQKGWTYEIDFKKYLQRNRKTGKDRPIRRADVPQTQQHLPKGKVTPKQLEDGIKYFVDLATLPEAPPENMVATPGEDTASSSIAVNSTAAFLHADSNGPDGVTPTPPPKGRSNSKGLG